MSEIKCLASTYLANVEVATCVRNADDYCSPGIARITVLGGLWLCRHIAWLKEVSIEFLWRNVLKNNIIMVEKLMSKLVFFIYFGCIVG
jgi:hypothetical protein